MEVLDNNDTNWLILTDDGSTKTKSKDSNLNRLLYGHDLWGLLDEGTEIWSHQGGTEEPSVTIIPDESAESYTMQIGDIPDLELGPHHKTDLVDALATMYQDFDGETVEPLLDLYDEIRENMVRDFILARFRSVFSEKVAEKDSGWFINGHLMLTFEGEFYHSQNVSRSRSGSVLGDGMSVEAYTLDISTPKREMSRQVTVDGDQYRLTDSEVEFLAKAMWAIEETPDLR